MGRPAVAVEFVGPAALSTMQEVAKQRSGIKVSAPSASSDKVFESLDTTAKHDNCSVCIVRPHAMREGKAGVVIAQLQASGFEISAIRSFSLTKQQSENFYEVYKTVLPSSQYSAMIAELASGVCLVIEVRGGADVVTAL